MPPCCAIVAGVIVWRMGSSSRLLRPILHHLRRITLPRAAHAANFSAAEALVGRIERRMLNARR